MTCTASPRAEGLYSTDRYVLDKHTLHPFCRTLGFASLTSKSHSYKVLVGLPVRNTLCIRVSFSRMTSFDDEKVAVIIGSAGHWVPVR